MSSSKFDDPASFGPGVWFTIHVRSLSAKDDASKKEFAAMVKDIIEHIKCQDCHDHAIAYIKKNPIERYFGIKDEKTAAQIGCFKWTWIFHNSVNKRIGKKELDFKTALMIYAPTDGKCTNCGSGDVAHKEEKKEHKHEETEDDETKTEKVDILKAVPKMITKYRR